MVTQSACFRALAEAKGDQKSRTWGRANFRFKLKMFVQATMRPAMSSG